MSINTARTVRLGQNGHLPKMQKGLKEIENGAAEYNSITKEMSYVSTCRSHFRPVFLPRKPYSV